MEKGRERLDGVELKNAFTLATRFLEKYKDTINALNVFPVPDGDTGTNLLLTMHSVNQEAAIAPDSSAESVAAAMARGALLGARGNSGVILSQFLQGLARGLKGFDSFGGKELAQGLELGNQAAYRAVSRPVEGTMLTVIRELAKAAQRQAEGGDGGAVAVWESALKAAREAVSRTPLQLPVLREAGVVDAGGQGMAVILEGALRFLQEDSREEMDLSQPVLEEPFQVSVSETFLAAAEEELYGYCTQFLIKGSGLDADDIRERMNALADSVVVVGDENLVKAHVHTDDPGPVLSLAVSLGSLGQVSIENIDEQHREFAARHREERERKVVGVLAVTWGEGFAKVFESLGAVGIVRTGTTMNPSARELVDCIHRVAAEEVIILPNNPNVIPVAEQATSLARKPAHVVPSRTLPQGIASLLAFNPEESADENLPGMESSLDTVHTLAITRAVRPSSVGGVQVRKGDYVGLLDDDLECAGRSLHKVLSKLFGKTRLGSGGLVTLYWGDSINEAQAKRAARQIQKDHPNVEVELIWGGQPLYQYIASVE